MSTNSDWERELWPDDVADPDWPEPDWPDDGHQLRGGVVPPWGGMPAPAVRHSRGPRVLALALVAVVGLGAGAGAVYLYRHAAGGSAPTAAATSPSAHGSGTVTQVMVLGPVLRVGRDSVTVGGAGPAISAVVTSATRFTGTARSLAQVHVGDLVSIRISESGRVARVVTLQDPASQP